MKKGRIICMTVFCIMAIAILPFTVYGETAGNSKLLVKDASSNTQFQVTDSGQLTLGKYGAEFEQKFAQYCSVRHGIAVSSGTSSLEIILRSLGDEGKDVLVPTNTFFATAAAVVHAGGNPVLVEMDPESFAK